jgi:murein DD-endopeptidase MepM/ murein hydrolase activator NlpD
MKKFFFLLPFILFYAPGFPYTVAAQYLGPPYFYPSDPAHRLYKLPFAAGKTVLMEDGYWDDPLGHPSWTGHTDYSLDFTMPENEPVLAARAGRVLTIVNPETTCGRAGADGNSMVIGRLDSVPAVNANWQAKKFWSRDLYLHIAKNVPVAVGQWVEQGQVIAYNSCTGQGGTTPPFHVHFEVNCDGHVSGVGPSVPTPFVESTEKDGYLTRDCNFASQNPLYIDAEKAGQGNALPRLSVSPNPVRTLARIRLQGPAAEVKVFALSGRCLGTLKRVPGQDSFWDASDLPAGLYLVRAGRWSHPVAVLK